MAICNEIDKQFTPEQLKAIDDALTVLETNTADLPVLSGDDKTGYVKARIIPVAGWQTWFFVPNKT